MRTYILSILSICVSIIALAAAVSQHSRAADEATRIEVDQHADAIRVFIDGEQIAQIDRSGLHVREGISYGDTIVDYDRPGFSAHIAQDRNRGE